MEDNPTARKSRRRWELLESASEVALLVGCFLVVAGLFFEDWVAVFRVSGEVAVIVGVTIEGLADGGIFLAAGKLRMIQDAELEKMRLQTAEAKRRTAQAELDLEELRAKVLWRHIDAAKFLAALQASTAMPTNTEIVYLRDDPESWNLANEVFTLLHKADWPVTLPTPIVPNEKWRAFSSFPTVLGAGGNPFGGIALITNEEIKMPTWEDKTPFGFLVKAFLEGLGGQVSMNRIIPELHDSLAAGAVRVVVGPRMDPANGPWRAKLQ
ncbi:hypothetical protein [Candidatus Binatus sp.]|uniref:hypothetical protein n=1 Tax=Candidatus Binatus sp. TaxID=2811406 RepID=UPI003CC68023